MLQEQEWEQEIVRETCIYELESMVSSVAGSRAAGCRWFASLAWDTAGLRPPSVLRRTAEEYECHWENSLGSRTLNCKYKKRCSNTCLCTWTRFDSDIIHIQCISRINCVHRLACFQGSSVPNILWRFIHQRYLCDAPWFVTFNTDVAGHSLYSALLNAPIEIQPSK
jgi:hypothetical protein